MAAVPGHEVLERIARHLAPESPELGRDRLDLAAGEGIKPGDEGIEAELIGGAGPKPSTRAVEDVERDDVGGRGAIGHGVSAAGVVADHAAHRAAGVGGGVGSEAQPVDPRLGL
jgi:hypothetical protein